MRTRSSSVKGRSSDQAADQAADNAADRRGHRLGDALGGDTNVLFDVWLVSRAVTRALDDALEPSGLSADEFGIYSVLTSRSVTTPSELARWMSAPATTVSSYVKRLEGRGHVTREKNPDDGRSYVLRLTPAGRRAHRAAGARFVPVLEQVVAALGNDEPGVRDALAALHRSLEGPGEEPTRAPGRSRS